MRQRPCPLPRPPIQAVENTWGSVSSRESSPSCSPFLKSLTLELASNPEADDAWRLITVDVAEVGVLFQGVTVHVRVHGELGKGAALTGRKPFSLVAECPRITVRGVLLVARCSALKVEQV